MENLGKKIYMGLLMDFYGPILTERQRSLLELYCHEDLSLSEISQLKSISRQGVRDALIRGENSLQDMENRLRIASRYTALRRSLQSLQIDLESAGLGEYALRVEKMRREWEDRSDGV